jgi:tetratricopeptide (TPR) repeat protein
MMYDQSNPEYTFHYATWLLANQKVEQGLAVMKKALDLDDKLMDRALTAMIISSIDPTTIEQAIPDTPGATISFAQFLYDTGNPQQATDRYLESLDLIERMDFPAFQDQNRQAKIKSTYYIKIYRFFRQHHDLKNAMKVMERAETELPMDAGIKITLGDLYYHQGILYKALEKYDHALLIQPDNKRAIKMMQKINP